MKEKHIQDTMERLGDESCNLMRSGARVIKFLSGRVAELESCKTKLENRVREFENAKSSWHRMRDEMNGLRDFLYDQTRRPCFAEADDDVPGPVGSVIEFVADLQENLRVESDITMRAQARLSELESRAHAEIQAAASARMQRDAAHETIKVLKAAEEPRPMSEALRDMHDPPEGGSEVLVAFPCQYFGDGNWGKKATKLVGWFPPPPSPPVETERGPDDGHSAADDAKVTAGIEIEGSTDDE